MDSLDKIKYKIEEFLLPHNQYYHHVHWKNQYVLHHTVSGKGAKGDGNWWIMDPLRIATAFIVQWDGRLFSMFDDWQKWGHHLGVKVKVFRENNISYKFRLRSNKTKYVANNEILNQQSIGWEIDSWGPLMELNGKWYPVRKNKKTLIISPDIRIKPIPKENIQFYGVPFRGFYAYEKYTDDALKTTEESILAVNEIYDLPLDYDETMWDVSKEALEGKKGIWSHCSYRKDKFDCHPQPELIQMLKSLNGGSSLPLPPWIKEKTV